MSENRCITCGVVIPEGRHDQEGRVRGDGLMPRYINADRIDMNQVTVYDYKEQKWTHVFDIPEDIVRCKDCKYFLYDKLYMVEGLPLMGNLVCEKWGNGCRTDENGYCFMGERREDAEH